MHGAVKSGPLVTVLKKEAFASYVLIKFKGKKMVEASFQIGQTEGVTATLGAEGASEHLTPEGSSWNLTVTSLKISHTFRRLRFYRLDGSEGSKCPPPLSSGNRKSCPNVNQSWEGGFLSYLYVLCDTVNRCDAQ